MISSGRQLSQHPASLTCSLSAHLAQEGLGWRERDGGACLPISITVSVSLLPPGRDPKTPVAEWIKFVKTFYLIWQPVFLSPTVDSVTLHSQGCPRHFCLLGRGCDHCGENTLIYCHLSDNQTTKLCLIHHVLYTEALQFYRFLIYYLFNSMAPFALCIMHSFVFGSLNVYQDTHPKI